MITGSAVNVKNDGCGNTERLSAAQPVELSTAPADLFLQGKEKEAASVKTFDADCIR
ncbi:MAG: hypothetical protein AB2L14_00760 [Candidatus Xenobiia bacterium LiM19]